ncbi:MAG TPA: PAS domain-containing protein [Stellaceae bacterium]|nr:PAS domain-containing protein [Stellaceae bacterium]
MPPALFGHATLSALLRYWEKKRGKRRMPARRDIDPIEMDRRVLPQLMLCEVAEHGNVIRFRLVGTSLAKRLGFDPTGQRLGDLPESGYIDFLGGLLRRSYADAAPVYGESSFHWGIKGRLEARHLLLPLSAGGAEPGIVLVATAYSSEDAFPPPIRVLDGIAEHRAGLRQVLTPGISMPEAMPERPANIA